MNDSDISGDQPNENALSDALSNYRRLTSRFDSGAKRGSPKHAGVELPLSDILRLIPEKYLEQNRAGVAGKTAFVTIPNLVEQLRKGKVTLPVQELAACVPAAMLNSQAFEDSTVVTLSLASVVNAMDPSLLEQGDDGKEKEYDLAALPDPFRKTEAGLPEEVGAPPAEPPKPEPAPVQQMPPVREEPPIHDAPPIPEIPPVAEVPVEPPPLPPVVAPEPEIVPEPVPAKRVEPEVMMPPIPEISIPEVTPVKIEPPPFVEPPALPIVEEIEPKAVEKIEPPPVVEPVPEPPPAPSLPPPPPPVPEKKPPEPEPVKVAAEHIKEEPIIEEPDIEEFAPPAGVNINAATAEHLVAVEGLSLAVARKIVEYREANGHFKSIFTLCKVPGISKKFFKVLTGMPFSGKRRHRGRKLAKLLNIPLAKISHMPSIAEAVGRIQGISGCVISDKEGLVITASQAGPLAEAIGAVAHEITSHMGKSMEMTGAKNIDSASISIRRQMFTIISSGEIYITVVHDSYRITGAKLALICNVAKELEWVLSRRLYVGT